VAIGESIGAIVSIAVPCALIYWVYHTGKVYDDFKANGIKTVAVITHIKQLSSSGSGSPKCVFTLGFTTQDGVEITTMLTQVVEVVALMRLERERKVALYYKKTAPQKVWLIVNDDTQQD